MPISIVIVKKTGVLQDRVVKEYNESLLYKEAGFKNANGFSLQTIWKKESIDKNYSVLLYAKAKGNAGQENKYDFPPPVDSALYFGSCLLVAVDTTGLPVNFMVKDWNIIYEHLFGGFEDLGSEDSEESEDDLSEPDVPRTKEGYVKDDFVVDDDEDEDEDGDEDGDADGSESSYEEKPAKPIRKPRAKKATVAKTGANKKTAKNDVDDSISETHTNTNTSTNTSTNKGKVKDGKEEPLNNNYLECTSELSEEAYFE